MPCSILRVIPDPDRDSSVPAPTPEDVLLYTGALAMLLGEPPHASLDSTRHPPSWLAPLEVGELVTVLGQPTDVRSGNRVLLDDRSGPVEVVVTPEDLPGILRRMRGREPASLIARVISLTPGFMADVGLVADGVNLLCVHLERVGDPNNHRLIPAEKAQTILDLKAKIEQDPELRPIEKDVLRRRMLAMAGEIIESAGDLEPVTSSSPFAETIEFVTTAPDGAAQSVRVTVCETDAGAPLYVEQLLTGKIDRPGGMPVRVWVEVRDHPFRTFLMAESALRLYARRARREHSRILADHDRYEGDEPESAPDLPLAVTSDLSREERP